MLEQVTRETAHVVAVKVQLAEQLERPCRIALDDGIGDRIEHLAIRQPQRGNDRQVVFADEDDYTFFRDCLYDAARERGLAIHAYVLMTNHFHLLVMTPEPNLSAGMQRLSGIYAQHFNIGRGRWGHLFGGRFKSELVISRSYLLASARYIVLNPVRAGLTLTADEWPWSSYAATAGLAKAPKWLAVDAVLREFHPTDRELAVAYYREFVAAGTAEPDAGVRPLYGA